MVTITTDHLTLDGQGSAVLDGGGGTQPVIDIVGAGSVTIQNLTVSHGFHGIRARQGAAVVLEGVTAQDNAGDGIQINEHSTARITNCTALRNGNDGIFVGRSSSATLAGTIVGDDNTRDGIHVTVSSSVSDRAIGNTAPHITTNNNVNDGIAVVLHSSFTTSVSGTMLVAQGNRRLGAEVNLTSMFFLGTGTTLIANGNGTTGQSFSGGVGVSQNASFT
jgi:parallel beta-helix repeat protein